MLIVTEPVFLASRYCSAVNLISELIFAGLVDKPLKVSQKLYI